MAVGARLAAKSTYALSTTGIAGPGGGTSEKPVGLVYIGLAGPDGLVRVEEHSFHVDREDFKYYASSAALELLRGCLTGFR